MQVSFRADSRLISVHGISFELPQSAPGLMALIFIAEIGTSAKFFPMMVTGIPKASRRGD
jgi:hypothetical protein